jgi:hypothetical protein
MEHVEPDAAAHHAGGTTTAAPPRRRSDRRAGALILAGCIAVVALIAVGIHMVEWVGEPATLEGRTPAPRAALPTAQEPAAPEPRYPVPVPTQAEALPALAESDAFVQHGLESVVGAQALKLFRLDGAVRRFVASVDGLPRPGPLPRLMPLRRPDGAYSVRRGERGAVTDAANERRYAPYVALVEAIDPKLAVALYARMYPLLQQQYRELGYPRGEFNDRVVRAIDDLLAAPDAQDAIPLAQPKVLYQFADPALESVSAGQKLMLRLGPHNEAIIKARLRALRNTLLPV